VAFINARVKLEDLGVLEALEVGEVPEVLEVMEVMGELVQDGL
jgi:hypothetical protein